jgi:hypothetical protein
LTLAEAGDGRSQDGEAEEACPGLVVTRGDTPEMLELADEALDDVALFVEMPVVGDGLGTTGVRRDDGEGADFGDGLADAVGVVRLVGDDVLGTLAVEQGLGLRGVVHLTCGEDDADELAQGVDQQVQLAAQPATRAANRLRIRAPFAPALC